MNLNPAKECTRHESQKDSFKYYIGKHPYTLLLKTCISLGDTVGNCEMSSKQNNNNMRSKDTCSLIENDMVLSYPENSTLVLRILGLKSKTINE